MTLERCARIVERGDPDRHLAALAAPAAARKVLLPLYAMNAEVARAPWMARDPLIARLRLRWWAEAMEEIAGGGAGRGNAVAAALAEALDSEGARAMADLARAREADVERRPFGKAEELWSYLDRTSGTLVWTAARLLGADGETEIRQAGRAFGMANWLQAAPELLARGREPLPDPSASAVRSLAEEALDLLGRAKRSAVSASARPALRAGWLAGPVLRRAAAEPEAVARAPLARSDAARKAALLRRVFLNRW